MIYPRKKVIMLKIIENSEKNYRVIDENGSGIATFYDKNLAEEYIEMIDLYRLSYNEVMEENL